MTEQCKHEWEAMHGYLVWCTKCRRPPKAEDVIRALNATERLSAEDALSYCEVENHIWGFGIKEACNALKAYANILEGKDE